MIINIILSVIALICFCLLIYSRRENYKLLGTIGSDRENSVQRSFSENGYLNEEKDILQKKRETQQAEDKRLSKLHDLQSLYTTSRDSESPQSLSQTEQTQTQRQTAAARSVSTNLPYEEIIESV